MLLTPAEKHHYLLIEIQDFNAVFSSSSSSIVCVMIKKKKKSILLQCNTGVWVCYVSSLSSSPQNFFQIISNLLEEENKEKWEDAQKVGMLQRS